jgi:hypothetical protein
MLVVFPVLSAAGWLSAAAVRSTMEKEDRMNTATHSHEAIEQLAHQFWEKRGRPCGTPEADWLRAERILRTEQDSILSKVARAIGSVVGHAVGILASSFRRAQRRSRGPEAYAHRRKAAGDRVRRACPDGASNAEPRLALVATDEQRTRLR